MALVVAASLTAPQEPKLRTERLEVRNTKSSNVAVVPRWTKQMKAIAATMAMAGTFAFCDPCLAEPPSTPPPELGLLNGSIRSCDLAVTPKCYSTSSRFGPSSAFPWKLPKNVVKKSDSVPIEVLKEAILSIEKNATIVEQSHLEDGGDYLRADVGKDGTLEFLVKDGYVFFRSMEFKNSLSLNPFNRPQYKERINKLESKLGWRAPLTDEDYFD